MFCLLVGGFKGYGLAMMVEVFCGILADAAFGPNVRRWKGDERVANLVRILIVAFFIFEHLPSLIMIIFEV